MSSLNPLIPDGGIIEGPLGLGSPESRRGDVDSADAVVLLPHRLAHLTMPIPTANRMHALVCLAEASHHCTVALPGVKGSAERSPAPEAIDSCLLTRQRMDCKVMVAFFTPRSRFRSCGLKSSRRSLLRSGRIKPKDRDCPGGLSDRPWRIQNAIRFECMALLKGVC